MYVASSLPSSDGNNNNKILADPAELTIASSLDFTCDKNDLTGAMLPHKPTKATHLKAHSTPTTVLYDADKPLNNLKPTLPMQSMISCSTKL